MLRCPLKISSTNYKRHASALVAPVVMGAVHVITTLSMLFVCPVFLFASEPADSQADFSDYYGYLYAGDDTGGSSSSKLKSVNYKGGGPPEWGIGIGRYFSDIFSVEGTFEYWSERYERQGGSVIPGTENNVIQVGGLGFSVSAVCNYSLNRFHTYAGIGGGYFLTGILVTQPGSGLLTDDGAPSDKLLFGYHAVIGLDYKIKANHKLGIEIKHRILNADFGQYTGGEVDVGGTYLLFLYRHSTK